MVLHISEHDELTETIKDARSVSLYPYNRSHILQYVKYTK